MIFLSEWGDKTQIASALFGAEYNPFLVLAGTLSALTLLSVIAIYSGKYIHQRVDRKTISRVSGAAFIIIGVSFLLF
jgi:putative Ca2+/H+ antiporter (TMEM165/GDT1 family)